VSLNPPSASYGRFLKSAIGRLNRRVPGNRLVRCQEAVDELDGDRPFSDGGGHSLDGSMPDVAGREDAGHAGFEQTRTPLERPPMLRSQIWASEQEALLVSRDLSREPSGPRIRPDEDEESVSGDGLPLAGADGLKLRYSSRPSPPPPITSDPRRTSTFGVASIS